MSLTDPLAAEPRHRPQHKSARTLPRIVPDKRQYKRVAVDLAGRFMRANHEDYACRVLNVSAGGMALLAPVRCDEGEHIVAYVEILGRIEGIVVRAIDGGFAARIVASPHKREKIVDRLTWFINRDRLGLAEGRRHGRHAPNYPSAQLILPNGETHVCRVIDISLSGASVASRFRPPIGAHVVLGRMRGRVVRHHAAGLAVQFDGVQDRKSLARSFA